MNTCLYHLCNNVTLRKFCSKKCKNKYYVVENRKLLKVKALLYKGNKCQLCKYSKCSTALEFHHLDPSIKEFGIAQSGNTRSWNKVKEELDKCVLLCANCHREVEAGTTKCSPDIQRLV